MGTVEMLAAPRTEGLQSQAGHAELKKGRTDETTAGYVTPQTIGA